MNIDHKLESALLYYFTQGFIRKAVELTEDGTKEGPSLADRFNMGEDQLVMQLAEFGPDLVKLYHYCHKIESDRGVFAYEVAEPLGESCAVHCVSESTLHISALNWQLLARDTCPAWFEKENFSAVLDSLLWDVHLRRKGECRHSCATLVGMPSVTTLFADTANESHIRTHMRRSVYNRLVLNKLYFTKTDRENLRKRWDVERLIKKAKKHITGPLLWPDDKSLSQEVNQEQTIALLKVIHDEVRHTL